MVSLTFDGEHLALPLAQGLSPSLLSPQFVSYIDALIVETPFYYACGLADAQFKRMYEMYDAVENSKFEEYISCKAAAWYERLPPTDLNEPQATGDGTADQGGDGGAAKASPPGGAAKAPPPPGAKASGTPPAVSLALVVLKRQRLRSSAFFLHGA